MRQQDLSHQLPPYPLNLTIVARPTMAIPELSAPPYQVTSGLGCLGEVPSQHLMPGLSQTYYDSVRQRERNCFRQLNCWSPDYSAGHQRTACLHTNSARCQVQSTPFFFIIALALCRHYSVLSFVIPLAWGATVQIYNVFRNLAL